MGEIRFLLGTVLLLLLDFRTFLPGFHDITVNMTSYRHFFKFIKCILFVKRMNLSETSYRYQFICEFVSTKFMGRYNYWAFETKHSPSKGILYLVIHFDNNLTPRLKIWGVLLRHSSSPYTSCWRNRTLTSWVNNGIKRDWEFWLLLYDSCGYSLGLLKIQFGYLIFKTTGKAQL